MFAGLPDASLCFGRVMHRRLRPAEHRFDYGVGFLLLRVAALESLPRIAGFAINRFSALSFHYADHGDRSGRAPEAWIRELLAQHQLTRADGEVWLQCFPRMFGYVFNPVSFWYCLDQAGALQAVVAEVHNTFGEQHCYLLTSRDGRAIAAGCELACRKVLHVSPFNEVTGGYRFRFDHQAGRLRVAIRYDDPEGPLLHTAVWGAPQPLAASSVRRLLLGYPLMTFGVMARIHWQALRLWLKKVPFFRKPAPPLEEVTR